MVAMHALWVSSGGLFTITNQNQAYLEWSWVTTRGPIFCFFLSTHTNLISLAILHSTVLLYALGLQWHSFLWSVMAVLKCALWMNLALTLSIHTGKKIFCAIMDCNSHYWFKQSCAAECLKYKFQSLNLPTRWEGPEPKVRNHCLKAERGNNSSDTNRPSCTLFERGSSLASLFFFARKCTSLSGFSVKLRAD